MKEADELVDRRNSNAEAHRGAGGDSDRTTRAGQAPDWLPRYRVTVPERSTHHVHRGALRERCMPTAQRLAVRIGKTQGPDILSCWTPHQAYQLP